MVIFASVGSDPDPRESTPGSEPKVTELILTSGWACSQARTGASRCSAVSTVSLAENFSWALMIPVSMGGITSLPMTGMIFFMLSTSTTTTPRVMSTRRSTEWPPAENRSMAT